MNAMWLEMHNSAWEGLLASSIARAERDPLPSGIPVHRPTAAVLGCSDARVPPSVIFDQPAGSLFVVRIAGNTASPTAVASLDFAVEQLEVDLLVVLGHTSCGAVAAAQQGACDGNLAPIVSPICELARTMPGATVDELVARNVEHTIEALLSHPGPTGEAARGGWLEVRGAIHDLKSNSIHSIPNSQPTDKPTPFQEKHP